MTLFLLATLKELSLVKLWWYLWFQISKVNASYFCVVIVRNLETWWGLSFFLRICSGVEPWCLCSCHRIGPSWPITSHSCKHLLFSITLCILIIAFFRRYFPDAIQCIIRLILVVIIAMWHTGVLVERDTAGKVVKGDARHLDIRRDRLYGEKIWKRSTHELLIVLATDLHVGLPALPLGRPYIWQSAVIWLSLLTIFIVKVAWIYTFFLFFAIGGLSIS